MEFMQGYITSRTGKPYQEFAKYKGGSLKNTFLPYAVDYDNIPAVSSDNRYDRTRELKQYLCQDKVLVKRTYNEQRWGAAYVNGPLIFSNDFSSFNDYSGQNKELLRYIEALLNSKIFRYYSFYMTKVKAAKKPEVVKEDILRFPMPPYEKGNRHINIIVSYTRWMERLSEHAWKDQRDAFLHMEEGAKDKIRVYIQAEIDREIFALYGLDEFQISVIEEGLERFGGEKDKKPQTQDYQTYAGYLCEYFNYYMSVPGGSRWNFEINEGDFYTAVIFYFKNNAESLSPDMLGLAGLEKVNGRLLVQKEVLSYTETGFQIVQTKERNNWTLGKARKMAARMTRQILSEGGMRV